MVQFVQHVSQAIGVGPIGKNVKDKGKSKGRYGKPGGKSKWPKSTKSDKSGKKFDGICNYCKKPGHMAKDCRRKQWDEKKKVGGVDGEPTPESPQEGQKQVKGIRGAGVWSDEENDDV